MDETLAKKLRILADAAKYDASCASSAASSRNPSWSSKPSGGRSFAERSFEGARLMPLT